MGRWARKPVNHTSWVALVTPTDRPKSVRNRCLIELFCGVVCVVTLPFWHFCWSRGFCHRTESDLFLFLFTFTLVYLQCQSKSILHSGSLATVNHYKQVWYFKNQYRTTSMNLHIDSNLLYICASILNAKTQFLVFCCDTAFVPVTNIKRDFYLNTQF